MEMIVNVLGMGLVVKWIHVLVGRFLILVELHYIVGKAQFHQKKKSWQTVVIKMVVTLLTLMKFIKLGVNLLEHWRVVFVLIATEFRMRYEENAFGEERRRKNIH
mmetsp:Transcript_9277/g.10778  ORF Transcript_9277/g.10778 Transcript_9277/m.10778 type:complete len:105 (-) Transcript_9277:187-501(-)